MAQWLENHAAVERVIYPGLPSHSQHSIAARQMKAFGGMITVVLRGGLEFARAYAGSSPWRRAEHPGIMTHASLPESTRRALGISDSLIRLSVGVEDVEDLREDLREALR